MLNSSNDFPQESLKIKQDNKFFSRLMSKENSKVEASFRVFYYGGASGAVPFMWESQPGTPKHSSYDTSLPPLTPPPSYQMIPNVESMPKHPKTNFFRSMFPRIASTKTHISPSFSSSSLCSSSHSLPSTRMNWWVYLKRGMPRPRSTVRFGFYGQDDEIQCPGSPTSTLGFDARDGDFKNKRLDGQKRKKKMKKALFSIVGFGMAQR